MTDIRNEQDVARGGLGARRKCRMLGRRGALAVEAAVCMPFLVALMVAMWQLGQIVEMSRIVRDAAREGARVAAGGTNNGTTVTVANVQSAVQSFLGAAGMPSAAVNGAVVTVTDLSSTDSWTNPGSAQPLNPFSVTVTIPAGAPFNSLLFISGATFGVTQLQETVTWQSANDTQFTVSTTLPY